MKPPQNQRLLEHPPYLGELGRDAVCTRPRMIALANSFDQATGQGPKKWFATKEGPRQEQAIFSGSVVLMTEKIRPTPPLSCGIFFARLHFTTSQVGG